MELQRLPESGFLYKGISVKYFSIKKHIDGFNKNNYKKIEFDWLTQSFVEKKELEQKRITLALERLQAHEQRKNILDAVQKNLDEKPLNNKTKRKI